jgi:hypothetical protein
MTTYKKCSLGCPAWCVWLPCFVELVSRALRVWVILATLFTSHVSQCLFPLVATSKIVCTAPVHMVRSCKWKCRLLHKRSQATCCVTQLTTLWFMYIESQWGWGSHIKHVFTRRPHAYKLSMKENFHSCIICFYILENYEYTIHRNCCIFF